MAALYSITPRTLAGGGVLLQVAFGSPAANTAIVAELVGTLKSLELSGGPLLLIDGPASLPGGVRARARDDPPVCCGRSSRPQAAGLRRGDEPRRQLAGGGPDPGLRGRVRSPRWQRG